MDPIWRFAQRNHNYAEGLIYDASYWYLQDKWDPQVLEEGEEDGPQSSAPFPKFYADESLYSYYVELKNNFVLPEGSLGENLIYERGHPLGSIPKVLEGDVDAKVIEVVFGIQNPQITVNVTSYPVQSAILDELLAKVDSHSYYSISEAFILSVGGMLTSVECQSLYLLSLNYERVTLFQPAVSNNRYLIAIGPMLQMDREKLLEWGELMEEAGIGIPVPRVFETWLTSINNTYLGINAETLIHLTEAKNAFIKQGMSYWPEMSYDRKRVINLLQDRSTRPTVINPRDLQRFQEDEITDEHIRYSMHLWDTPEWGEFEDVAGSEREVEPRKKPKLHMYIDFANDKQQDYNPKIQNISGDNWGQRKLLLTEIQFLTEYTDPDRRAVVFYVGASPFDHGTFLLKYFENVNFVLIDPRPVAASILQYQKDRVMIIQRFFSEDLAEQIVAALLQNTPAKDFKTAELRQIVHPGLVKAGEIDYLYISDIRTDVANVSVAMHEKMIEKDMELQSRGMAILAKLRRLRDANKQSQQEDLLAGEYRNTFVASVKFRHSYDITDPYFTYEEGVLAVQPWAPLNSTELRLWTIPGSPKIRYDKLAIEKIMAYHNLHVRQQRFDDPGVEGYDECHDCHLELEILDKFARRVRGAKTEEEVYDELVRIRDVLSLTLGGVSLKEHVERKSKPRIHVLRGVGEQPIFDPFLEYHRALAFVSVKRSFSKEVFRMAKGGNLDKRKLNLSFKQFMLYLVTVRQIPESPWSAETGKQENTAYHDAQLINWKQVKIDPSAVSIEEALQQILAENEVILNLKQVGEVLQNVNYARELSMLRSLDSKGVSVDVEFFHSSGREGRTEKQQKPGKTKKSGPPPKNHVGFSYVAPGPLPQYVSLKRGEKIPKVTSLEVHQDALKNLLTRRENPSDYDIGQLLHSKSFLDRAFCILTRYKNVHFQGICNAPQKLIERIHPEYICGVNVLSADGQDYGAVYTDFELQYTPFNNPFTYETFASRFQRVLVFPPNIKPLIISYIQKWQKILRETEVAAVVFVLPLGYDSFFEAGNRNMVGLIYAEVKFDEKVYDHCEMHERSGKGPFERKVHVLKTERSGFTL